jgi:hypothetical protein
MQLIIEYVLCYSTAFFLGVFSGVTLKVLVDKYASVN